MTTEHTTNTTTFEMANGSDLGHKFIVGPTRSGMSIFPALPNSLRIVATVKIMRVGRKHNKTADDTAIKKTVVPFYRQFGKRYPT